MSTVPLEIPLEIVYKIQSFLPINPLIYCRLALVSKSFYAVFTSDHAWKDLNPYGAKSHILETLYAHSNIVDLMFIRAAWYDEGKYLCIDETFRQNCQRNNLFVKLAIAHQTGKSPRVSSPELMRCEIVMVSGNLIACGSRKLRKRRDLTLLAVQHGAAPSKLDPAFFHDNEIMELLIKKHRYLAVQYMPAHFLNNLEFMTRVIEYIPTCYSSLSERLLRDRKLIEIAMEKDYQMFTYTLLRDDTELVKKFVAQDGANLRLVGQEFRHDAELVKLAVKNNPTAAQYMSDMLQESPKFLKDLVDVNPDSVEHFPKTARQNASIMMYAVAKEGSLLRFASSHLRNTNRKLVETAVCENGLALSSAPNFKSNRAIVAMAARETPLAFFYAAKHIQNDVLFVMQTLLATWEPCYKTYVEGKYEGESSVCADFKARPDYVSFTPRRQRRDDTLSQYPKGCLLLHFHRAPRPVEKALWLLRIIDSVKTGKRLDHFHDANLSKLKALYVIDLTDSPSKRRRVA